MKLSKVIEIKGRIEIITGLHIGAGNLEMRIGGTDNPIVKHPITNDPYIPGSSLKGKIRSLLEMKSGLAARNEGKPICYKNIEKLDGPEKKEGEAILKLFGSSGSETHDLGPSRVSFSDCHLNREWKEKAHSANWPLTETKSENSINRVKGVAENPRFTERVSPGAEFDFSVTLKVLQEGEETELKEMLLTGMRLLELDALGGSGSRGYGRVRFLFEKLENDEGDYRRILDVMDPFTEK